jgi:hypothetical protein
MNIDYTIGDDVVAIKSHSQDAYKEGDLFTCKGLKQSPCKCKTPIVDIGIKSIYKEMMCLHCKHIYNSNNNWWFNAHLFQKLDNLVQINEVHEILRQTTKV